MSVLVIMIPLSLILVIGAGIAFFWAVNHDQFDDMQTPSLLPMSDNLPRHRQPADEAQAQTQTGQTSDHPPPPGDAAPSSAIPQADRPAQAPPAAPPHGSAAAANRPASTQDEPAPPQPDVRATNTHPSADPTP